MKFSKLLILSIFGFFYLLNLVVSKLKKAKKHSSDSTRNYRKVAADPSYNPLPASYETGPRHNFGGGHNHKKYRHYTEKLAQYHNYHDTTQQMNARASP